MNKIARCIRKLALSLAVLSAMLLPVLYAAPAHAQLWHSWVSNSGVDGNPCTEGQPCATFARALTQTDSGGEVSCLNSGSYVNNSAGLTITQSVTIDCNGVDAWASGDAVTFSAAAITINGSGIVVHLRNLDISGITGFGGQSGVVIQAAAVVNIENCTIKNLVQSGISAATSGNTILNVRNTSISNAGTGISLAPTGGAVNGSIDHTMISKTSGNGITASSSAYFTVTNSVIANAAGVGVSASAGSVLEVDSSSVSNNNTAFATSGGIIRISRNTIYDNNTNFSISGGTIATSGDNKVAINGSTAPNGTIAQQ